MDLIKNGDLVLILTPTKKYIRKININTTYQYPGGYFTGKNVINKPYGYTINNATILHPSLEDIILYGITRQTQVVYPKDIGYIILKLGISSGKKVLEFGTGSGAFATILSILLYPDGKLFSLEKEKRFYKIAKKNISTFGKPEVVELKNIAFEDHTFSYSFFDAAFVDVKDPIPYIKELHYVLKPGAPIGFLLPTVNQVIDLVRTLSPYFSQPEVTEILIRKYKPNPERLRPEDIMPAHTAYLVFSYRVVID